jgi:hypothetical protein
MLKLSGVSNTFYVETKEWFPKILGFHELLRHIIIWLYTHVSEEDTAIIVRAEVS